MIRGALIVGLVVIGAGTAYFFTERSISIAHAREAISRANEYWEAGSLLFEPRYLEAEKAVADVTWDSVAKSSLSLCLTQVRLERDSREIVERWATLKAQAITNGTSPDEIAKFDAQAKDALDQHMKYFKAALHCTNDETE